MELSTVAQLREAFLRLVGTDSDDPDLTARGEDQNEVLDIALTHGARAAQLWLLDVGYGGWRKRSTALTFTGTDDADGGRSTDLPADFLRAVGRPLESALREANGKPWGCPVDELEGRERRGNYYYIRGEELWLSRLAQVPSPIYLEYHYTHPEFEDAVVLDFPINHRTLLVAEAAAYAIDEDWFPLDAEGERKIQRRQARERERSRKLARQTTAPRRFRKPVRFGNHW